MTDNQKHDGTHDDDHQQSGRGFSRRGFLGAGAGGLASAVVVGTGLRPAGAAVAPAGAYVPQGALSAADPHAATAALSPRVAARRAAREGLGVKILPLDRATFRPGARFDLRVEVTGVDPESSRIRITVEGPSGPVPLLTGDPVRTSNLPDSVEVEYEGLSYPDAGTFTVSVNVNSRTGRGVGSVTHEVLALDAPARPAKNVIFFLGDGMGAAPITAARILSKGITEGKYNGLLEMDRMDYRGLVMTSGDDSIATDSANSMSAYMTGHKSSVNAMGVYVGNSQDPDDHPRVETLAEILKRTRNMAVGVVTTSEIQDATPAAVWAHTRRRAEYVDIMDQALLPEQMPDVLLGGGRASLLPRSTPGSRRQDERNLIEEFQDEGFAYAADRNQLSAALGGNPEKLLGLFHNGNLNVYVDREVTRDAAVLGQFPDQPTLMEMTEAALEVLSRRDEGFMLMVEAASIDKMSHPLDGPRAVYDTIEFDQALGVAKRWAEANGDTLVVVTADHNHSMSIVGTHDRRDDPTPDRQGNGVYAEAGFPTYTDTNGDGFPDDPNPDVQLFFGWSNHPDHSDDFQHNARFAQPALIDATGRAVDNPARDPGALVQIGNLPYNQTNCVHTVEDVYVIASGAGAAKFNGVLDNTEVFHAMVDALGLEIPQVAGASARAASATTTAAPVTPAPATPAPATPAPAAPAPAATRVPARSRG
ncbi:alkaline phosphatase [Aquipuribacter sp. MA13-6]|uniref:alkaline phosphatase n=1 Tax=unclassified Aquipuribacter TaxID=2635084 RepID=UPI003EEF0C7E